MLFHHGVAWLAVVTIPLLVGGLVLVAAWKAKSAWGALLLSPAAALLSLILTVGLAYRCSEAMDVRLAAKKLLNPKELATLQGTGFLCPSVYKFKRDGEDTCLVADGDGGALVGCG